MLMLILGSLRRQHVRSRVSHYVSADNDQYEWRQITREVFDPFFDCRVSNGMACAQKEDYGHRCQGQNDQRVG